MSADALRVAAGRGRLQATRGADGHWRSTRAWVDDYLANRYRRRLLGDLVSREDHANFVQSLADDPDLGTM